jgi:hypothetical protein
VAAGRKKQPTDHNFKNRTLGHPTAVQKYSSIRVGKPSRLASPQVNPGGRHRLAAYATLPGMFPVIANQVRVEGGSQIIWNSQWPPALAIDVDPVGLGLNQHTLVVGS